MLDHARWTMSITVFISSATISRALAFIPEEEEAFGHQRFHGGEMIQACASYGYLLSPDENTQRKESKSARIFRFGQQRLEVQLSQTVATALHKAESFGASFESPTTRPTQATD